MITELMNEAQSSFRTHYRSEKADFTQFLRAIRAMWIGMIWGRETIF